MKTTKKKQPKINLVTWLVNMKPDHQQLLTVDENYQKVLSDTDNLLFTEYPTSVVMHRAVPATQEDIQRLS